MHVTSTQNETKRAMTAATEQHYSYREIADIWRVSVRTVSRVFDQVPGVIRIGIPTVLDRKKQRVKSSVPKSILEQTYQNLRRPVAPASRAL